VAVGRRRAPTGAQAGRYQITDATARGAPGPWHPRMRLDRRFASAATVSQVVGDMAARHGGAGKWGNNLPKILHRRTIFG
jgi:hypothetical protein